MKHTKTPDQKPQRSGVTAEGTAFACVRCGYPVPERPLGCRWPCPNCRYLYPMGDCSD